MLVNLAYANEIKLTLDEKLYIKENPIITLGSGKSFAPYVIKKANGEFTGLDIDIAKLIEKKTGFKINFEIGIWSDIQIKAQKRELDGLSTLIYTKEREKYYNFTSSYVGISMAVLTNAGNPQNIYSLKDLKGKKVSVQYGNKLFTKTAKDLEDVEIIYYPTQYKVLNALLTKEVDFTIYNDMIFYSSKNVGLENFIDYSFVVGKPISLRFALRNDKPKLVHIINKALASLDINEINKIRDKWFKKSEKSEKSSVGFTKIEQIYIRNKKKVFIANELDFIPYDYNEDNIAKGFIIDYTKLVFSKIGLEVIFVKDKWKRLYKDFLEKKIDILPILTYSSERNKVLKYTNSYFKHNMSIITKKNRFNIVNMDDLNGKTISVSKGWNSAKFIRKYHPKIKLIEYDDLDSILNAVENNLVEATILDELSATFFINKKYKDSLKIVTSVEINNFSPKIYMGVNNDSIILRNIINKAMSTIKPTEIEILNTKWLNINKGLSFSIDEEKFIKDTTLNVISTTNWAPFSFINKNNKWSGVSNDFWSYITNKANLKTATTPSSNFSKSLEAIKEKKHDVIISSSKNEDREKFAIFSDTYQSSKIGIATLKDKKFIQKINFLDGKKVGVGKNYTAHKLLLKHYPKIDFILVKNVKEGLDLLSQNKIYAFADIMPVLTHNITTGGYTNLKISGQTDIDFNISVMIRNDYHLLQSIINKTLRSMSESERDEIYDKWLNAEITLSFDYELLWKIIVAFTVIILIILYKNRQMAKYQNSLENIKIKLERKNIELESFIQEAPNPIMVYNDIGEVLIINKSWLSITKYSFDEIDTIYKWRNKAYGKKTLI